MSAGIQAGPLDLEEINNPFDINQELRIIHGIWRETRTKPDRIPVGGIAVLYPSSGW